jgi:hypothetical protein
LRRLDEEEHIKGVKSAGYESDDIIGNLETLYVIIFISATLIFVVIPALYLIEKIVPRVKKYLRIV